MSQKGIDRLIYLDSQSRRLLRALATGLDSELHLAQGFVTTVTAGRQPVEIRKALIEIGQLSSHLLREVRTGDKYALTDTQRTLVTVLLRHDTILQAAATTLDLQSLQSYAHQLIAAYTALLNESDDTSLEEALPPLLLACLNATVNKMIKMI